jgi:hypothetical protein
MMASIGLVIGDDAAAPLSRMYVGATLQACNAQSLERLA